jgi:Alpha-galactosidases/6-phospho-beta-glucosidases, family 4 of glycosyl hydrolases
MKKIKIATIGGGSSYTPELIEGFIKRKNELDISELWLVDCEEGKEKLEIVGALARRMVMAAGLDWKINLTLDREKALKDADFVTTQLRVGLLDARIRDERIPLSHGVLGQETNGAGGLFKAFRTIPVILEIIEDMKKLCPDAWLINFTNPSGMVTEAAINYGKWEKTIGLCNVPIRYEKLCCQAMGLADDSNELFTKFAGLNHFHWHRVWNRNGKEITEELIEKIYAPGNEKKFTGMKNILDIPFNYDQIKDLKVLPCSYHRYYYIAEDMLEKALDDYGQHKTRAEIVKATEAQLFEVYKDQQLDHKPELLSKRGGTYYSDAACEVIASILNDKRSKMVVNTPNKGAIYDLPYDSVVEISSIITSHGPEPLNWGKFTSCIRGMLQHQKAMEELTIEAAVTGNYGRATQAFINNVLIKHGTSAKVLLDEMLIANKRYLPQFAETIEKLEKKKCNKKN